MGICKSKQLLPPRNPEWTTAHGVEDQPYCSFLFRRRKIRINNNTSANARIVITPGPITNLKSLQIEKVGSVEVEHVGKYRPQKFHILGGNSKKLRVKAREFYVTCLLQIKNDEKLVWSFLWENRLFSCFEDICIIERHIDEALLTAQKEVDEQVKSKRKQCPILHIADVDVYERYNNLTPEQKKMWKFSAVGRVKGDPLVQEIPLHDFAPESDWDRI